MNSGDDLTVDMHDTAAGFQVVIHDLTTGQSGSMTASVANGLQQVKYEPTASTCHEQPYAYHPMYGSSSEHTRVPWAAHTYNVAFSDEIGHFEYCNGVRRGRDCTRPDDETALDDDDVGCFNADDSLLVPIGGCLGDRHRLRRALLRPQLAGNGAEPRAGPEVPPDPDRCSRARSSTGTRTTAGSAFETDLPRIEAADFGGSCDRLTGNGCTNPPPGADVLPDLLDRHLDDEPEPNGHCVWQVGGPDIKGTTNTFGGNSTAEYGPLLFSFYPGPNPATRLRRTTSAARSTTTPARPRPSRASDIVARASHPGRSAALAYGSRRRTAMSSCFIWPCSTLAVGGFMVGATPGPP